MTLSTTALLSERIQYDFANVSQDELHDAALDLEAWQDISPDNLYDEVTPETLKDYVAQLEQAACGCNIEEHEAFEDYRHFFNDCLETIEEYRGRFPCAGPRDVLPLIQEAVEKADEYKTALINIRQALKDGESADYIASLIPDNLEG
jgi:hypothetical protein